MTGGPDSLPGWQIISELSSGWMIPLIILFIVAYSYAKKVKVYEVFVEGAKEGFDVAVMIIPYLIAIFAAIALFRASGALEFVAKAFGSIVAPNVMPAEILMMALIKPMSGSGARGLMMDVFNQYGVDTYPSFLASAIQGSTETTFYVIAVYFGSVGVRNTRYTVGVGLVAELIAVTVATVLSYFYWHIGK
jgi:spore maturation protein SpmB